MREVSKETSQDLGLCWPGLHLNVADVLRTLQRRQGHYTYLHLRCSYR